MDRRSLNIRVYSELFIMRCMLLRLITFLEDENACKAAGYNYYSKYKWTSGKVEFYTISLGYDECGREKLRFDISHNTRPEIKHQHVYLIIKGAKFMDYTKKYIETFCSSALKYGFDMQQIMANNKKDLQVFSIPFPIDSSIPIDKHYKPSDTIRNMILELPDLSKRHISIYPYIWFDVDANEHQLLKSFTKEHLLLSQKFINGPILGADRAFAIPELSKE